MGRREQPPPNADPGAATAALPPTSRLRPARPDSSPTLPAQPTLWVGSHLVGGRLRVVRSLGQGGMGTVYLAFDMERRCNVALKTLNQLDAASIYQLKNEFRSLADVHHPNLVRLHELFCDRDCWFFTMDVVEGERFDTWVRPEGSLDEMRLRAALLQLVDALDAIHASGKLHRDVKPSNVLVQADGRLRVLDFGLVVDPTAGAVGHTVTNSEIAGTPDYMAPEQAMAQPATTATDFYALGVMLYEALSGKRPFSGNIWEVLSAKFHGKAAPPLPDGLPRDLAALCEGLLARDPHARPPAAAIRTRLGPPPSDSIRLSRTPPSTPEDTVQLVGRSSELQALRDAYAASQQGAAVLMSLAGESGIGKSALCRAFLRELRTQGDAVLLTGRCYEQENVPYKAIDPVIDELSRYLRRLRPEHAAALLPRDAFAVAKLFPVLTRVRAFEDSPVRNVPDPRELQRLAYSAFTELLARIRDRSPIVVYIDDLQWTDADSARLIRHYLVSREVVPMLFLISYRPEDEHSHLLASIIDAANENPALDCRALTVQPLTAADTQSLAEHWLSRAAENDTSPGRAQPAGAIAIESRGNPFFAMELARFAQSGGDDARSAPSLAALLEARVAAMSGAARNVLQALALAGRPMSIDVLLRATGADHAAIDALRDSHLVCRSESTKGKLIECYHDRVRESVCAAMTDQEKSEHHRGLARALQGEDLPELLSRCLEGAGEPAAAAKHAAIAAEQASLALAFDHAAELYQRALQLGAADRDGRRQLLTRLGRALENTGRGAEAAGTYLQAAGLSDGTESLDLQRRAAEQLLHSGQFDRGFELLCRVCEALGIELPETPGGMLVSLGVSRLKLRLRPTPSTRTQSRARTTQNARDALRLRALRTAVTGLIGYKPLHCASIDGLYLLHAQNAGDSGEYVRALGFHAHNQSLIAPASERVSDMLAQSVRLAEQDGRPELVGFARLMQGTNAYHHEACREARGYFEQARKALRECTGVEWEIDATNIYDQLSALYAGDYAYIARTTPSLLDQAARRRRVWSATMLSGFAGMPAWLANDDVRGYRQKLKDTRSLWPPGADPGWPGFLLLYAEALVAIYAGEPALAFDTFDAEHGSVRRTPISRMALTGALGYATHRGRCAAAALGSKNLDNARRAQLGAALRESIETLKRRGLARSKGMGAMLDAALAALRGDDEHAVSELRAAVGMFDRSETRMHAAAARRRLGQLLGGSEGEALIAAAETFMRSQGVREVEPMTELNCPGFRLRIG